MRHPARALRRFFLWLRFQLFQRHRFNRLVVERVAGKSFLVLPGVFNPTLFFTSEFMVDALDRELIPEGSEVLDMGTGTGVVAVFAAQWAASVVAVDISAAAVRCARINALLNGVEDRMTVLEGDLFTPVGKRRFDVILFNPPYYRGAPSSALDRAFHATDVVERFATELCNHLCAGGHALVLLSSAGDDAGFLHTFQENGFRVGVTAQRDLVSEVITLYRLFRPDEVPRLD